MILKKPYAFLIKHFRLIHLLLLIPISYLINKTFKIVTFFRTFVANNYTTSLINIAGQYINFFMYIAVLFIIIAVIAIYYLMRQKEKSTRLYFFILIYYLILFVLIGVSHGILSSIEQNVITAQVARAYRDISLLICLPEYFFFIYVLIRGIGFDIKQFNFANDLKDLEITDIDSEEFEFSVNIEGYKVKRTIRRYIREFNYYVRENVFVFLCIAAVIVITIGTSLYMHFAVYNKTYHITDRMAHSYFNIEVKGSMLTNMGFDGKPINKDKYYLVIQLFVQNISNMNHELDYDNFRLVINDKNYYPTLDRGEYFIDYGTAYHKEKIKKGTSNTYALVYELTKKEIKNSYEIKILEGLDYKKAGDIIPKYKILDVKPKKILSIENVDNYDMKKTINLKDSNLGYTTFKVNSYEITNGYTYTYDYCYSKDNCTILKDRVTTDTAGTIEKTTLLVLNMNYNLDRTTIYANNIRGDSKFFDNYFSIEYQKGETTKILGLKNRTTEEMKDLLVFELRDEVNQADKINLLVTVRNKRYTIKLK